MQTLADGSHSITAFVIYTSRNDMPQLSLPLYKSISAFSVRRSRCNFPAESDQEDCICRGLEAQSPDRENRRWFSADEFDPKQTGGTKIALDWSIPPSLPRTKWLMEKSAQPLEKYGNYELSRRVQYQSNKPTCNQIDAPVQSSSKATYLRISQTINKPNSPTTNRPNNQQTK